MIVIEIGDGIRIDGEVGWQAQRVDVVDHLRTALMGVICSMSRTPCHTDVRRFPPTKRERESKFLREKQLNTIMLSI